MYTIFHNGIIHSLAPRPKKADTIVTLNGRIVFTGNRSDINLPEKQTRTIDLKNHHIIPAFTDCHTHFAAVAIKLEQVDLGNCENFEDCLTIIAAKTKSVPQGKWIRGGGWNSNLWNGLQPHKKHLDQITTRHPVVLYNKDAHTLWLNSLALRMANITTETTDPPGGKIERDEFGEPTGLLYESAWYLVEDIAPKPGFEDYRRSIAKFTRHLNSLGITSVHSCETIEDFDRFQQLHQRNELNIRICMHPPVQNRRELFSAKLRSGFGDDRLRVGGLKYFVDGSLGSQTAEMFEKFDNLDHSGIEVIPQQELTELVLESARHGFASTIHAIGDKANHKALNAIETARKEFGFLLRHRIEHAQILRETDIPRFSENRVIASMQPLHISDDVRLAEKYLGPRGRFTFAAQSLITAGCRVVFGSDMPVADPDPIKGILAAVTRKYLLKQEEPSWNAAEKITAAEAVFAYTREAAFAGSEENEKGTIEPGKLADFVVLNDNILQADENKLRNLKVLATVYNGEMVYRAADF